MKLKFLPKIKLPKSGRFIWSVVFILAILFGISFTAIKSQPDGKTHISFYDVGQGDSAFITTPKNHQILIDGGPDSKVLSKLSADMPFYDRSLDLVVLSHPHADHVNGLIDVLKRYQVDQVLFTGVVFNSPNYTEFLNVVKDKKIPTKIARSGEEIDFSDGPTFNILWPTKSLRGEQVSELNNSSIVLRLDYEGNSVLFPGDFEVSGQKDLSDSELSDFKADILKVSHHGSYTGTNLRFLRAVDPKYAIISVGADNRFGHPHENVLKMLSNIKVYRTDKNGDIKVIISSDGKLDISSQK